MIKNNILRLTKHTIIYGTGHILSRSIGLILFPIHTNFILPEDMGIAAIFFLFLAFMTVVYQLGFAEAFLRYFALAKTKNEREKVFSNALISNFFSSITIGLFIFLLANSISNIIFRTSEYGNLFILCSGIIICDVLSQTPLLTLRVKEKSLKVILVYIFNISVNISMNIPIFKIELIL